MNTRKKILYVITKSNWGGAQRYVHDLAVHFAQKHDVAVACGGEGTLRERLSSASIRVIPLPELERDVHILKDIRTFFDLLDIIRREHPDVLHLNSSKIGALGALAGRLLRVPRVLFTAHGWAWNEDRSTFSKLLVSVVYFITLVLCHETIAVSESVRKQATRLPFVGSNLRLIRLGIGEKELSSREEARTKLPEKARAPFVIGTIAELHPIKGISYAIEAIKELNRADISYVVWGEGEMRQSLEESIRRLGLQNHVFLQGHMHDAETHIRAFDCFVLPSLSEALGYVILEAGRAGLPVVASAVGGVPEIIESMHSGILVQPEKPSEIAGALSLLLDDENRRRTFGAALQKTVHERFSQEKMFTETQHVYEKTD
ncbi:MAG: glycosyl transferase [Candidatus Campbellbacteria bacterium]